MISAKINSLRQSLRYMGLSASEADEVCRSAAEEISEGMRSIVESAVHDVENQGIAIQADEFLAQIRLDAESGYVQVSTDTGALDFSLPPTPMLPWLLKNAKVAKDGSRYKVIPVGASTGSKPKPAAKDIAAGLAAMSSEGSTVESMAQMMAQSFTGGAVGGVQARQEPRSIAKPEFRVASDKQDATRQWVAPAKDLDMTGAVMQVNDRIRDEVDRLCDQVIARYEREAEQWRS